MTVESSSLAGLGPSATAFELTTGELPVGRHAEAFRLRHQVLCESLGELPINATALERDSWDDRSLHVHASLGDRLVAYIRVILPDPQPSLMESLGYNLDGLPADLQGQVAEPSRMLVDPRLARGLRLEHDLFGKISAAAYRLSVERGITGWVFDTDASIERTLRQRGWPIVRFGDTIEHHGVVRAAFFVRLAQVKSENFQRFARRSRPDTRNAPELPSASG